jgi:hypothetical protein
MDARPGASAGEHAHGGPLGRPDRDGDGDGDREHKGGDRNRDGGPGGGERHDRHHFRGMWDDLHDGFRSPNTNKDELKKKLEEWRAARDDRRKEHRARLMSRHGSALGKPEVSAELRVHAQRMARLARMEEIAGTEKTGDDRQKLLDKIDKLRKQENDRHERAMDRLTAGGAAPTPSGIASAPAAAASAPPAPAASAGGTK